MSTRTFSLLATLLSLALSSTSALATQPVSPQSGSNSNCILEEKSDENLTIKLAHHSSCGTCLTSQNKPGRLVGNGYCLPCNFS